MTERHQRPRAGYSDATSGDQISEASEAPASPSQRNDGDRYGDRHSNVSRETQGNIQGAALRRTFPGGRPLRVTPSPDPDTTGPVGTANPFPSASGQHPGDPPGRPPPPSPPH